MANRFYKLEEYTLQSGAVVTKSTSGEYRCSCGNDSMFYRCYHIKQVMDGTADIVGARRFSENEKYIK